MKKKVSIPNTILKNMFGISQDDYAAMPRKKKKKTKRKLEQDLSNKFKFWLQEYERRTEQR